MYMVYFKLFFLKLEGLYQPQEHQERSNKRWF